MLFHTKMHLFHSKINFCAESESSEFQRLHGFFNSAAHDTILNIVIKIPCHSLIFNHTHNVTGYLLPSYIFYYQYK